MRYKIMIILLFFLLFPILSPNSIFAEDLELALVSDIGGFSDVSYNEQLKKSLTEAASEFDFSLEFIESNLMTEYLENINYFAEKDFDLIWGVGFTMERAIKETAQMYPKTNFILFDGNVEEKNVMSIIFKKEEAAFLAGVTAALASESSVVAFLGGKNIEAIRRYQLGFQAGVQAVNSDIKVLTEYSGSFNDFSRAKKSAADLEAEGADIIFYVAGAAARGVIDVALAKDIRLISLDAADLELAPKNILAVVIKNTDFLVKKIISGYIENNDINGIKEYGIEDKAFILKINQNEKIMNEKKLNKIEEYKQQYLAEEIDI